MGYGEVGMQEVRKSIHAKMTPLPISGAAFREKPLAFFRFAR